MAPEALDSLTPEERPQFNRMLRLRVVVQPDSRSELSGVFTDGQGVCTIETTSPCCGHRTHSSGATFAATSVGHRTDEPRLGYLGPPSESGADRLELMERGSSSKGVVR
jgi:hypothetical protein